MRDRERDGEREERVTHTYRKTERENGEGYEVEYVGEWGAIWWRRWIKYTLNIVCIYNIYTKYSVLNSQRINKNILSIWELYSTNVVRLLLEALFKDS